MYASVNCYKDVFIELYQTPPYSFVKYGKLKGRLVIASKISPTMAALRKMVIRTTVTPTPAITPTPLLEKGISMYSYLNLSTAGSGWVYLWFAKIKQAAQEHSLVAEETLIGCSAIRAFVPLPYHNIKMDWLRLLHS